MARRGLGSATLRSVKASLGDFRRLARARSENRLIEVEYPYHPRLRDLPGTPGGQALIKLLERGHEAFARLIGEFARLRPQLERIPATGEASGREPYWANDWLPGLDAISVYGLLATRNPSIYLEVGSGNSTKFARRAISDHNLRTRIVSIDPEPRAGIDRLCDEVIRKPLEAVPLAQFSNLPPDSLVFIDSSHRSFPNSDVTVFFAELLPAIPRGAIWGLHDIYLPYDYPDDWSNRFYNEQYLLMAYLLGGAGPDTVLLPVRYIARHPTLSKDLAETLLSGNALAHVDRFGDCFWMQRG